MSVSFGGFACSFSMIFNAYDGDIQLRNWMEFWIIFFLNRFIYLVYVHSFGLVLGVYALCDMSETATKRMTRYLSAESV